MFIIILYVTNNVLHRFKAKECADVDSMPSFGSLASAHVAPELQIKYDEFV